MAFKHVAPLKVYISYSHQDESVREELEEHLALLEQQALIAIWHDGKMSGGQDWGHEIETHTNNADIILLLISHDSLSSNYINTYDIPRAMRRHEAGQVRVIPIIIGPCDWRQTPLSILLALPKHGKPISEWEDREAAFSNIEKNIRIVVEELRSERQEEQLLKEKAILISSATDTLSQSDKEKELERVERELKSAFDAKVSEEVNRRSTDRVGQVRKGELTTNILTAIIVVSLSFNLVGLFEILIYGLQWGWLIKHPNSYGLQASVDVLLALLVVGLFYPMWRKWCWGAGAFAVVLIVLQILGGPPQGQ